MFVITNIHVMSREHRWQIILLRAAYLPVSAA